MIGPDDTTRSGAPAMGAPPTPVSVGDAAALREALAAQGLWHAPADTRRVAAPWYVTLLQAGGAWMAALFLLPALAWFVFALGDTRNAAVAGVSGFALLAGILGRAARGRVFPSQIGAALGLAAGILALGWALDRSFGWLLPLAVGVGLYVVAPAVSSRFLNGLTIAAACYVMMLGDDPYTHLLAGSLRLAALLGWLALAAWLLSAWRGWRHGESLVPLAWAFLLAAGVLVMLGVAPFSWTGVAALDGPRYWQVDRLACALLPLASWGMTCLQARPGGPGPGLALGVAAGLLVLVPLGQAAPGLPLALTWLIVGFAQSRLGLMGIAALGVIGYLGRYYYQLDTPLLHKAAWLGAAGLVLAVAALVLAQAMRRRA